MPAGRGARWAVRARRGRIAGSGAGDATKLFDCKFSDQHAYTHAHSRHVTLSWEGPANGRLCPRPMSMRARMDACSLGRAAHARLDAQAGERAADLVLEAGAAARGLVAAQHAWPRRREAGQGVRAATAASIPSRGGSERAQKKRGRSGASVRCGTRQVNRQRFG